MHNANTPIAASGGMETNWPFITVYWEEEDRAMEERREEMHREEAMGKSWLWGSQGERKGGDERGTERVEWQRGIELSLTHRDWTRWSGFQTKLLVSFFRDPTRKLTMAGEIWWAQRVRLRLYNCARRQQKPLKIQLLWKGLRTICHRHCEACMILHCEEMVCRLTEQKYYGFLQRLDKSTLGDVWTLGFGTIAECRVVALLLFPSLFRKFLFKKKLKKMWFT